jgi:gliding motility-associated-like protein
MLKFYSVYLVILFSLLVYQKASAQQAMKGKEFWLGFLQNSTVADSIKVFITGEKNTTGIVHVPLQNWSTNFSVLQGQVTSVTIPVGLAHNESSEVLRNTGINILTEDSVNVFALNYHSASTDASYIIPSQFLKTDYLVMSYKGISTRPSDALIVATTDNTVVEIITTVPTRGGTPAGQPITITMNAGQTFLLRSMDGFDLTGTRIKGKGHCHPFAVFGGTVSAFIPEGCWYADHLYEQLLPIDDWGKEYVTTPLLDGTYTFRILASQDNTIIHINNSQPINLDAGKYLTIHNNSSAKYITSSAPVCVAQFLESGECSKIGDPALAILTPFNKPYKNIIFSTSYLPNTRIKDHYITIIGKSTAAVKLNGNPITSTRETIPALQDLYYTTIKVNHGSHLLESDEPFLAYISGIGEYESYFYMAGYSGSIDLPEIVFEDPICVGENVTFEGISSAIHTWEWVFEDSTILEGKKVSYAFENSGYQDVYILTNRNSLEKCPERYIQNVYVHPKPNISISSDHFICEDGTLELEVSGPSNNTYLWSSGQTESSIIVNSAGSYHLYTHDGTCERSDTIEVKNLDKPEVKAISDLTICANEKAFLQTNHKNALEFHWSTGETTEGIYVSSEGYYTITVTNKCGSAEDQIYVKVLDLPEVDAGADTTILLGTSGWLSANGNGFFQWEPPFGLSCSDCPDPQVFVKETTSFTLTITDKNGCKSIDQVTVFVDPDLAVYVPNIFSPNGDGINDVFYVRGKGVKSLDFMIFNRWGEKIFESSNLHQGWDGTHRGKPVNSGVFVYYIDAILETDQRVIKKGDVTVIR